MLELQIGLLGWAARKGEAYTEDWVHVVGTPGQAIRLARDAIKTLPTELGDEVKALLAVSADMSTERHRLVHGVLIFDPETSLPSSPWLVRSAKGLEAALIGGEESADLVVRLQQTAKRAAALRMRVATWVRSRTSEGLP